MKTIKSLAFTVALLFLPTAVFAMSFEANEVSAEAFVGKYVSSPLLRVQKKGIKDLYIPCTWDIYVASEESETSIAQLVCEIFAETISNDDDEALILTLKHAFHDSSHINFGMEAYGDGTMLGEKHKVLQNLLGTQDLKQQSSNSILRVFQDLYEALGPFVGKKVKSSFLSEEMGKNIYKKIKGISLSLNGRALHARVAVKSITGRLDSENLGEIMDLSDLNKLDSKDVITNLEKALAQHNK